MNTAQTVAKIWGVLIVVTPEVPQLDRTGRDVFGIQHQVQR
jgi:hypothetical protein